MIRLAMIGCGNMGTAHRRALQQLAGRATVTAAVDVVEDRARATAKELGANLVATDYHQVLDHIDAAIVALPHHLHHAVGMDLVENGKHVLMEKPLANSEAQCLDLIAAALALWVLRPIIRKRIAEEGQKAA